MSFGFSETPSQEKQKPVEEKLETGGKVFEFLERTGFLDVRESDERFEQWFQSLSYEDYIDYLTRLNGILRVVPTGSRSVDGRGVQVSFGVDGDVSYLPPAVEQKDGLMRDGFAALKEITNNEDRALLAYYMIQAIHPYADGNGRTGRLIHELMSGDGKELTKENLSELLNHDKRGNKGVGAGRNVFSERVMPAKDAYYLINREVAKDMFGDAFLNEFGKIYYAGVVGASVIPANVPVSEGDKNFVQKIIGEGDVANFPFRSLVILKFLRESEKAGGGDCSYAVERRVNGGEVVHEDIGKKIFGIDDVEFESMLTADDVERLIEIHGDVKVRFIRKMIDIFRNPEEYQLKAEDGSGVQIKSVFHSSSKL